MSLSNEVSGEIAIAMLHPEERSESELLRLKEVVLLVHATLQKLDSEDRSRRYLKRIRLRDVWDNEQY